MKIKEIMDKEPFPITDADLYPGDYIIDIAKKILSNNKNLNFDNFDKIEKNLTKLSVAESLKMIKLNLGNIGINHDNFETSVSSRNSHITIL